MGRGREALYGRDVAWEAEEVAPSWFRVSLGDSVWNGLVAEGAVRPEQKAKEKLLGLL